MAGLGPYWDLHVNGDPLPAETRALVLSMVVDATVGGADELVIRARALDSTSTTPGSRYRLVNDNALGLGNEVVAFGGYADGEVVALQRFRIMRHEPQFPAGGSPTITIRGYSAEHRLVEHTEARAFDLGVADSEIVREIAEEHGLTITADSLEDSEAASRVRVKKAGTTDWQFVQQLAVANDYGPPYVRYDEGLDADVLYFRTTSLVNQTEVATFVYDPAEAGSNEPSGTLWTFNPSLSLAGVPTQIMVIGWDPVAQEPVIVTLEITAGGLSPITIKQGDVADVSEYVRSGAQLQVTILDNAPNAEPSKREVIVSDLVDTTDSAIAFANRWFRTRLQAFSVARARTVGFERLWVAQLHRFEGLPAMFAGLYEVLGCKHVFDSNGYRCELDLARVVEEDAEQPQEV